MSAAAFVCFTGDDEFMETFRWCHGRLGGTQVYTGSTKAANVYKSFFPKEGESKPQGIRPSSPLGQLFPLQAGWRERMSLVNCCGHWSGLCQFKCLKRKLQPPPLSNGGGGREELCTFSCQVRLAAV